MRTKEIEKLAELGLLAIQDELAEYKGKWAVIGIYDAGYDIGEKRFLSIQEAQAHVDWLNQDDPWYDAIIIQSGECILKTRFKYIFPIPVKS